MAIKVVKYIWYEISLTNEQNEVLNARNGTTIFNKLLQADYMT